MCATAVSSAATIEDLFYGCIQNELLFLPDFSGILHCIRNRRRATSDNVALRSAKVACD